MSSAGVAVRRPETAADDDFLLRLFRETHGGVLAGLDPVVVETLLRHQYVGRAASYRAAYPDARHDVLEVDGVPVGRIVTDTAVAAITLVDLAFLSEWRGRGLGTRLVRDLLDAGRAGSRPVRLRVGSGNAGALRLYLRLGFVVVGCCGTHRDLEACAAPERSRNPPSRSERSDFG